MPSTEVRLTKRVVEAAAPPERGSLWLRDTDVKGLSVRVRRSRKAIWRTYVISWPDGRGGTPTATLGHHGAPWKPDPDTGEPRILTVELARQEAMRLLGGLAEGRDPAAARRSAGGPATLRTFAPRYLAEWCVRKAPRTVTEERGLLERHLLPLLGDERLAQLGPVHVSRLQAALRAHPVTANRCRSLLSTLLNVARTWGELPASYVNPCPLVPPYPETGRERPLTIDELARVGPALVAEEVRAPRQVAAIRTLMLTGGRPVEILAIKLDQLPAAAATGVIVQESLKTRRKRRPLYVNALALAIMEAAPRVEGNPYVFPGATAGRPLTIFAVEASWERVRTVAKVEDVKLYDLRHTFGTIAAMLARNIRHVQDLLGHGDLRTTEKYMHLGQRALAAAGDDVALEIAAALEKGPKPTG